MEAMGCAAPRTSQMDSVPVLAVDRPAVKVISCSPRRTLGKRRFHSDLCCEDGQSCQQGHCCPIGQVWCSVSDRCCALGPGEFLTCFDLYNAGFTKDGNYTIILWDASVKAHIYIDAQCDMSAGGYVRTKAFTRRFYRIVCDSIESMTARRKRRIQGL